MAYRRKYVKTVLQILIAIVSGIALNLLTNTIEDPLKHLFTGEQYQYVIWLLLLMLVMLYFVDAYFGDGKVAEANKSPRQELIDGLTKRYEKRFDKKMDSELRFEIHLNLRYTQERASERFRIDTLGEENAGDFVTLFQRFTGNIRRLLIVGEPGSGKTVLLLKFARRLLDLAQQDVSYPVPVILNLATWRDEGQEFATWVEQNLVYAAGEYGASKEQAKELVKDNKLLLLLDGLDEAPEADRDSCLRKLVPYLQAVNARRSPMQTYPEVIICSRREEYNAMMAEAPVQATVLIQPLEPDQVRGALQTIRDEQGKGFSADRLLGEIDQHPLLLTILTTTFFIHIALKLAEDDSFDFASITTSSELVKVYVRQQINNVADRYPPRKTLAWLSWLAGKLAQARKSIIFELADMQPYWLRRPWIFIFFKSFIGAMLLFLLTIILDNVEEGVDRGNILIGILYGCTVFIWDISNLSISINFKKGSFVKLFKSNILYALMAGLIIGYLLYIIDPSVKQEFFEKILTGFVVGIILSIPFGTILAMVVILFKMLIVRINTSGKLEVKTKDIHVLMLKIDTEKIKSEFVTGFKKRISFGWIFRDSIDNYHYC